MGLLDDLLAGQTGASPWGALYQPSSVTADAEEAKRRALEAATIGSMGIDPMSLPQRSPFDVAPQPPAPAPTGFGAGASPFGFAGPGSMTGINPAMLVGAPQQPAPPAAAPATDLSSVNRPPIAAPAPAADEGPDSYVPVGSTYKMPMFGEPGDAPDAPAAAAPRVVAPGAPAPGGPAPFSLAGIGDGVSDRLMKGTKGFLGNLQNGPIGAVAGGLGALITGRSTDAGSIAAEHANATAQALVAKGATPSDVIAAKDNPPLMAALIQQYYGKDKYKVVQTGENDGVKQFQLFNETDGTMKPIPGSGGTGGGADFVTGPDGKQIPIPPGANRKEFIKQVTHATADAATGKATEAQAKASSFAARMTQAEGLMGGLQNEGQGFWAKTADNIPIVGNYLQSTNYQKYKQASSAFVTAMLRQESGAAINKDEFTRYEKELFPQPGDDASVVKQKAAMRSAAIQQMTRAAGPGYQRPPAAGTVDVGGKAISWSVK